MNQLLLDTLTKQYERSRFKKFTLEFFNQIDLSERAVPLTNQYSNHIDSLLFLGEFIDQFGKKIHILDVKLKTGNKLEQARTMQRNLIAQYLKDHWIDGALVAFYSSDFPSWRLSLVKVEYKFDENGKTREELSPAKRFSFLVGQDEPTHTAQNQLNKIFEQTSLNPTLDLIEEAFSVEKVTKEFFEKYRELFESVVAELKSNHTFQNEAVKNNINTESFAKKLLGQIVFLYFLQKKGWLGVPKNKLWGEGDKMFLRNIYKEAIEKEKNFFNSYLEVLFYDTLNNPRNDKVDRNYSDYFNSKIPFLNGGLFEPQYNWRNSLIYLDNSLFGEIFDVFDLYNFTVKEDEPLEKEVAVDPEMLGKVFENLLEENLRKGKGTYYTPREIVHYMCEESLINYLQSATALDEFKVRKLVRVDKSIDITQDLRTQIKEKSLVLSNQEVEEFDQALANIKICDPACGSGAFLVGMLQIVVSTRDKLTGYMHLFDINTNGRLEYELKKETIQNCIYGVDIDPGAIEIAKLRLWLSLVVDYDLEEIEPLPNLDYKIMVGNSLIEKLDSGLLSKTSDHSRSELIDNFRELKDTYFNLSDNQEKKKLRIQINELILLIENYDKEKERKKIWDSILAKNNQVRLFDIEERQKSLADIPSQVKQLSELEDLKETDHFEWHLNFNEVFENGGFNVVIANPPYIGEKGHKEMFREIRKGSLINFYQRKMDLFYFFFHLAINLGKQDSNIAFITTNYYPTATGGKILREDFKNRVVISRLINLNELKIFESALGQHNMITILQKRNDENATAKTCMTKRKGDAKPEILQAIIDWKDVETDYFQIKQKDLYDGDECYIRLAGSSEISDNPTQRILEKMKSKADPLKIFCHINMGVQSGADAIGKKLLKRALDKNYTNKDYLLKNQVNIGDKIYIIDSLFFNKLPLSERGIIKPFIKNSEIKDYFIPHTFNQYYIYADSKVDINEYPTIKQHLLKFRPILKAREQVGDDEDSWYWIRGSKREFLINTGPHIVCPYRSKRNTFALTDGNIIGAGDIYYITRKDLSVSLNYILALLNSKLYYLWLYHRGKRKGETMELYQQPLSEIPIKKIAENEQKPFIEIVDKILTITQSDDYLTNPEKQARVKDYEKQIDQLVYKLYGLTPEDIKIVEGGELK